MQRPMCVMTCALICGLAARASAVERQDVLFQIQQTTTFGNSVFVLGDVPELGGGDVTRAVKLEPGSYPTWRATIALPLGTTYTYRYTLRSDAIANLSNPANNQFLTEPVTASTETGQPMPASKSVFYHTGFARPALNWRQGGGAFSSVPMIRIGPGRSGGEWRWALRGIGVAQREVEFYFSNLAGAGRDPATGSYRTLLDAAFVQNGHLFNYVPPPTVSTPVQTNLSMFSTVLNEQRGYRVLAPRGYTQNTERRYSVLYLHDGQNVFDMGPFGSWNADETAEAMTRAGQMQELIIIGVDNTSNRIRQYLPPDDSYNGQQGQANLYARFLIEELKPVIDTNYRTLAAAAPTGTLGSSMGGIVSLYLGWDYTTTFGRIGAMSGAWQFQNFRNRVGQGPRRDIRIYMDSGDSGASQDNAWPTFDLRDRLMRLSYPLERDLKHVIGYGHQHNEAAWAARLPTALSFLYPADEPANDLFTVSTRPMGDVDDDGDVDATDVSLFAAALLSQPIAPEHLPRSDLNGDQVADGADISAFITLAWVNMAPP